MTLLSTRGGGGQASARRGPGAHRSREPAGSSPKTSTDNTEDPGILALRVPTPATQSRLDQQGRLPAESPAHQQPLCLRVGWALCSAVCGRGQQSEGGADRPVGSVFGRQDLEGNKTETRINPSGQQQETVAKEAVEMEHR